MLTTQNLADSTSDRVAHTGQPWLWTGHSPSFGQPNARGRTHERLYRPNPLPRALADGQARCTRPRDLTLTTATSQRRIRKAPRLWTSHCTRAPVSANPALAADGHARRTLELALEAPHSPACAASAREAVRAEKPVKLKKKSFRPLLSASPTQHFTGHHGYVPAIAHGPRFRPAQCSRTNTRDKLC